MTFKILAVHHGYGYGYHKREAEADADAHGYAYEKVTKTICKKTPITEEVSKDFELCRPKPSEVSLINMKKCPTNNPLFFRFVRRRRSRCPGWFARSQLRRRQGMLRQFK